ncbi:MAG: YraN family protein [Blautia sp.]|nr:YraN family protein [Blautia sp.]
MTDKPLNKRLLGAEKENLAAAWLEDQGLRILARNYRCRLGEIDLIAKDQETVVFLEIKYRKNPDKGEAVWAVDMRKQRVISKVAKYYLTAVFRSVDIPCRFDVIGIDGEQITWIRNAFDYIGKR